MIARPYCITKKSNRGYGICVLFVLAVVSISWALWLPDQQAAAQHMSAWSDPRRIPGLFDSYLDPLLVADPQEGIHVFHSQDVRESVSIVYTRWSSEKGWSLPVDIIESPQGQARVSGAFLDGDGKVHIVFFGGDDRSASMYYTWAPRDEVQNTAAWSSPVLIGAVAITPATAALVGDGNSDLVVIYSGRILGNGLYAMYSQDSGKSWSQPAPIFLSGSDELWPFALKLTRDRDGTVHAVWSVADTSGNSQVVYYANSVDYENWSTPYTLDLPIEREVDMPAIMTQGSEIMVIYDNGFPITRWMRRSTDGGHTWSHPARLFEQVGGNGPAALVTDATGVRHMFFGNRLGFPATHGLWHSTWLGDRWNTPEAVVAGPQVAGESGVQEGFDPAFAQAVLLPENILFVIWRHDPIAGPTHIWYSYLDQAPSGEIFTPAAGTGQPTLPSGISTPAYTTPDPQSGIETLVTAEVDRRPAEGERNPGWLILLGATPVVILIGMVIVLRSIKK